MQTLFLLCFLVKGLPTPPSPIAAPIDSPLVIVLDQSTADLLARNTACGSFQVLVHSEKDTFATLDRRALAMRHARYVLFRSDRISLKSQMLRDRLSNQGICHVDVVKLFPHEPDRVPAPQTNEPCERFTATESLNDRNAGSLAGPAVTFASPPS